MLLKQKSSHGVLFMARGRSLMQVFTTASGHKVTCDLFKIAFIVYDTYIFAGMHAQSLHEDVASVKCHENTERNTPRDVPS